MTTAFRPRLWPSVITAAMLAVLLGLGAWQVERLHWKESLLATIDNRVRLPPESIETVLDAEDSDYRPVRASGDFADGTAFYLLAISLKGEGGYHVLAPLRLADNRYVLVDRGWIPYALRPTAGRQSPGYYVPRGRVSVTGILRRPGHGGLLAAKNDPASDTWSGLDLAAMSAAAGLAALQPYVLEADASPNPGGFPVGGQTRLTLPNNHFGYALTWFGLAFALLVIYAKSCFGSGAGDSGSAAKEERSRPPDA